MYFHTTTATIIAALVAGSALTTPAAAATVIESGKIYNFSGLLTGGGRNANGTYALTDTTSFAGLKSGSTVLLQINGITAASLSDIAITFGGVPLGIPTTSNTLTGLFNVQANGNNNLVLTGNISGRASTLAYNGSLSVLPTALPEPAAWATMILGMGAVGYFMRRRQKVTTRVSYAG